MTFLKRCAVIVVFLLLPVFSSNLWAAPKGAIIKHRPYNVSEAYQSRVLGLFVGIHQYEDSTWDDLTYPEADVRDMVDFFSQSSSLSLDYKMILTNPKETTRDTILNQKLDEFKIKNSNEQDIVIVYVSSHGNLVPDYDALASGGQDADGIRETPYIITTDAKHADVSRTAIPLYRFIDWFENLKSTRKVMILDMCRSAHPLELAQSPKGMSQVAIPDSQASIILASCPLGGVSFEDEQLGNSVYTHFLIEGMRNGDLNQDGAVSISEAHNYAIDKTKQYTLSRKNYCQVPTAYSKILGKDPIVVSGTPHAVGQPTLSAYTYQNQGLELYVDDTPQGIFPKGVSLEPGVKMVEIRRQNETIFKDAIDFKTGYEYTLDIPDEIHPKKWLVFLEGGYRTFSGRKDIPDKLVPDIATFGISVHYKGLIKDWFGLSAAFDYGRGEDLNQYALRIGPRYIAQLSRLGLLIGPDLMFMQFAYDKESIAGKKVDKQINFICPGAEAMFMYSVNPNIAMSIGVRSHYLTYELNEASQDLFATQAFVSVGYNF